MNNPTDGHLGSASNPINQDQKWTAKKSYPLSASRSLTSPVSQIIALVYDILHHAILSFLGLPAGLAAYILALAVSAFAEG